MKDSKNSISCSNVKKKSQNSVSPFQIYAQNQPQIFSSHRLTQQSNQEQLIFHTCLSHSLPFTNICFTCNFNLLCPNCLNEGSHKNHDFRNLQKGFSYMKNSLKQYVIKLEAKFNLLTNLTEQLSKCKIDIFSDSQDYKCSVQQQFKQLIEQIQAKQIKIIQKIQNLKQEHQKQMQKTIISIKKEQNDNLQCQKQISQIIQNANQKSLHYFFQKDKQYIEEIVDQKIISELQKKIYEISWSLDFQQIKIISHKIKNLNLNCKVKHINPHGLKSEFNSKKKLVKYKSQTDFKYKEQGKMIKKQRTYELQKTLKLTKNQRNQKQRDSNKSYAAFFMTPKENCSREKNGQKINCINNNKEKKTPQNLNLMKKRKKSSGKNISMPVSPIKQQKNQIRNSPNNIDAMKKKKLRKNM